MKITSVSYVKLFPLGAFTNEKIGVELSLEKGEDAMEALTTAKNLCHEFHEKSSPVPLYEDSQLPEIQVYKPLSKEQSVINAINQCTTIQVLESFKLLVKNTPTLQQAYDNRLNELKND